MSKARPVITALFTDHQSPAEGEAAWEPRSRRPKSSPAALVPEVVDLIVGVRKELTDAGLDAGPETIAWHLAHHHHKTVVSRSSIARHLDRAGLIVAEPKKRPKSSYIRFQASMPNETWQSDFTHYRLTHPDGRPGTDVEIISWLDDCTRYALHVSTHTRITTPDRARHVPRNPCPARDDRPVRSYTDRHVRSYADTPTRREPHAVHRTPHPPSCPPSPGSPSPSKLQGFEVEHHDGVGRSHAAASCPSEDGAVILDDPALNGACQCGQRRGC